MAAPLWTYTEETEPYRNLAREEVLLRAVRPGECILYLWQNRHTMVVGRNQNCWKECDVDALEADGGFLARRLSGGGAVYHDLGNLNFTFLACGDTYDLPRQLSVIVEACRLLGVRAEVSGRNDLTAEGRKFSGNAFYRSGERRYHHGTLLLHPDLERMNRFLNVSPEKLAGKGVPSVRARVVGLREFCPGLDARRMGRALVEAFGNVYGAPAAALPAERVDETAVESRAAFYASPEWRFGPPLLRSSRLMVSRRFGWGDFQLYAKIEDGRLRDVRVFSDAMDGDWMSRLPRALEGARCGAQSMADAVRAAGRDGDAELAEEIARFLLETPAED